MKLEKSHQETKEVGGSIGPRKSGGGAVCCSWRWGFGVKNEPQVSYEMEIHRKRLGKE